jgi:hypothetical protein
VRHLDKEVPRLNQTVKGEKPIKLTYQGWELEESQWSRMNLPGFLIPASLLNGNLPGRRDGFPEIIPENQLPSQSNRGEYDCVSADNCVLPTLLDFTIAEIS